MTPEHADIAARLASRPWWRWIGGMAVVDSVGPARLTYLEEHNRQWIAQRPGWVGVAYYDTAEALAASRLGGRFVGECIPDLDDPATVGCLIAILRDRNAEAGWEMDRERVGEALVDDHPGEALARLLLEMESP